MYQINFNISSTGRPRRLIRSGSGVVSCTMCTRLESQLYRMLIIVAVCQIVQKCAYTYLCIPVNIKHLPISGSMLGQRRRRWTNIDPALG